MNKFSLDDMEISIAPTGASDAVGGPLCVGIFVIALTYAGPAY